MNSNSNQVKSDYRRKRPRPKSRKFACRQSRKRKRIEEIQLQNEEEEATEVILEDHGKADDRNDEAHEQEMEILEELYVEVEVSEAEEQMEADNNNDEGTVIVNNFFDNSSTAVCDDFITSNSSITDYDVLNESQVYSEQSEERINRDIKTLDKFELGISNANSVNNPSNILSNSSTANSLIINDGQVYSEQSEERINRDIRTLDKFELGISSANSVQQPRNIVSDSITNSNFINDDQVHSEQSENRIHQKPTVFDDSDLDISNLNIVDKPRIIVSNSISYSNINNNGQVYSEQSEDGENRESTIFDDSELDEFDDSSDDLYSLRSEVSNDSDLNHFYGNKSHLNFSNLILNSSYESDDELEFTETINEPFQNLSQERVSDKSDNHFSSSFGQNHNRSSSCNKRTDISSVISGRRIVDMAYFLKEVQNFGDAKNHQPLCTRRLEDVDFFACTNIGLNTLCYVKCLQCQMIGKLYTNPPKPENDFHINQTAVISVLGSASSFAAFQTTLAVFDVPYISYKSYRKYRDHIIKPIQDSLAKEMHLNALKEAEIAIQNGDVTPCGIPLIKGMTDGFFGKRSYVGGKYNSLGGSVALIGCATQKVIDIEVLNKFCSKCVYYQNRDMEPPEHECFMNFDRKNSSSSMESIATTTIFNRSLKLHGLIIKTLVSDDDSSTYKAVLDSNPYRDYNITVERIKCINHLFRRMGTKIKGAAGFTDNTVSHRRGVGLIRSKIKASGLKIRRVITIEIDRLRKELDNDNLSKDEKQHIFEKNTEILRKNIPIAARHVFGDHDECPSEWTCDTSKPNYFITIKEFGLYSRIEKIMDDLSSNADHLLHKETSNRIEQYHAILAKYLSGKRIFYNGADEFHDRIYMGALDQTTSGVPLSTLIKFCKKNVPPTIEKLEKEKDLQRQINKKCRLVNKNKPRGRRQNFGPDKDYGPNAAQPDLAETYPNIYQQKKQDHHEKLRDRQRNRIFHETETRKELFFGKPHCFELDMIPTSITGKICRMLETTSCVPVINDICNPFIFDDDILETMNNHREKSLRHLESKINYSISSCGIFISNDEESFYLCARPDGLVNDDSIVILNCISDDEQTNVDQVLSSNRNLKNLFLKTASNQINDNHALYYMIQGQLHVTGKEFCYFAVYTPNDMKIAEIIKKNDNFWNRHMKEKLNRFYHFALVDEVIDSRIKRSMPVREAAFTIEARAEKAQKDADKLAKKAHQQNSDLNQPVDSSMNDDYQEFINVYRETVLNQTLEDYQENIVMNGSYLDDISISRFLLLVEDQGFTIQLPITILEPLGESTSNNEILILGGYHSNPHWCCSHFNGQYVAIYDSLNRDNFVQMSDVEQDFLKILYPKSPITFHNVTQQPDGSSCGVYAAAYATTIALGGDPTKLDYSRNAAEMRHHLFYEIIANNQLVQFPSSPKN